MYRYYLNLGLRSLRRNPVLTGLIVLTLSIGVAASMATLTVLHGMSGDPLPHKSDRLFVVQLDNNPVDQRSVGGEPPEELSWPDVRALWEAGKATRQSPVFGIGPSIDSGRADVPPFFADGVAVGRDFFAMFEPPLLAGQVWSADEDARGARVAVLGRKLAERMFGEVNAAIGKVVKVADKNYSVVGVLDTWQPLPKVYRLIGADQFIDSEELFLPARTAIADEISRNGNTNCNTDHVDPGFQGLVVSECTWAELWVELDAASDHGRYLDFLNAYVAEQKKLGRFPSPLNNRLRNAREWMDFNGVVSDDTKMATWLAFGFLLVCLVNAVGLMLAKFSARPGEIGVRRALGASRGEIFRQFLTEAGVLGLAGAGLGIALTLATLAALRAFDPSLELIAVLDAPMTLSAVALSVIAALLAGLLPTWRACQVLPAMQLKSQ